MTTVIAGRGIVSRRGTRPLEIRICFEKIFAVSICSKLRFRDVFTDPQRDLIERAVFKNITLAKDEFGRTELLRGLLWHPFKTKRSGQLRLLRREAGLTDEIARSDGYSGMYLLPGYTSKRAG